jgi:dTDP-4-amino-4,6-dideoxygalactose transaminase
MINKIPFNKPFFAGKEVQNIVNAAYYGHLSANGPFTKMCHYFFEERWGFKKTYMTTSCTDAFEMAALLMDLKEGDEVIMPSFTFVSTTSPFILRGAKLVFADSRDDHPNMDMEKVEELITEKTKVLVVMHYGGVAVDMDKAVELAEKYNLILLEDVAHAIDSYYKGKPLGTFGDFAAFSFHETKNVSSGEGGLLAINNEHYIKQADIVWEKGTNRTAFEDGKVNQYEWVGLGASYNPSDMIAGMLLAQLESIEDIQRKRIQIWEQYSEKLKVLEEKNLAVIPHIPDYATNNGHLFYLLLEDKKQRDALIKFMDDNHVMTVFHYLPLHNSPYFKDKHDGRTLPNCERYADTLVRLPFFYELPLMIVDMIADKVKEFFEVENH